MGASGAVHNSAIADGNWHSFGTTTRGGYSGTSGYGSRGYGYGYGHGYGYGRGYGWYGYGWRGYGCWGCGWGWGWGWGWPWALSWWAPYWYYPSWWWGPGYVAYPSPYYQDGAPYAPPPDNDDSGYQDYYSYGPPYAAPPDSNGFPSEGSTTPQRAAPAPALVAPVTGNVAESKPTILLYLTDGTVYPATDYWVADNMLHYVVSYGGEGTIRMDQVDLQRTINENAKRGVRVSLRPKPDSANAPPITSSPAGSPTNKVQPIALTRPAA
jgi:hypothetical protein